MRPGVAARLQKARLSREERTLVLLYLATWHATVLSDALDHVLGVRGRRDGARRANKLARRVNRGTEKASEPGVDTGDSDAHSVFCQEQLQR